MSPSNRIARFFKPAGTQKSVPDSGTRNVDTNCGCFSGYGRKGVSAKRSYAGITQIRYKGQYLLGYTLSRPFFRHPPGVMKFSGCFGVIIAFKKKTVQKDCAK